MYIIKLGNSASVIIFKICIVIVYLLFGVLVYQAIFQL